MVFQWFFNDRRLDRRPSTARASKSIDVHSFSLIFTSCSMNFQRSTAGASTIDGRSFEIYRCSLISNHSQWFYIWFFNDRRPEHRPSTAGASKSIDVHWFSMIVNDFSKIFQRSTAGASTIDGRSFEIYRCSLIFNDSQWFYNDFSTIDGRSIDISTAGQGKSIDVHCIFPQWLPQWFFISILCHMPHIDGRSIPRPSTAPPSSFIVFLFIDF